MTPTEFAHLQRTPAQPKALALSALPERNRDRTLLYGYTCNRHTVHVYLMAGVVHAVTYAFDGYLLSHRMFDEVIVEPDSLVPDKRLYPESCDAAFCLMLKHKGVYLPFTTFTEGQHETRLARNGTSFAGSTLEALKEAAAA